VLASQKKEFYDELHTNELYRVVTEEIADELEKHYTINGPKNFPDALCLVFLRTGPTTATLTSVYPSKEAYDRATEQRKKAMNSHEGKIKSVKTEEGIASTFVLKQSPPKNR
jgi:hypothetical protein